MWKNRILSALGAAALTAALTFAVVRFSPAGFTQGTVREGLLYEATGVPPDAVVAVADGNGATADLYGYWMNYEFSQLGAGYIDLSDSWDAELAPGTTLRELAKNNAVQLLRQHLAIENLAKANGVTLTAEDRAELAAERAEIVELYGADWYRERLAGIGVSESTYDRVRTVSYLINRLYDAYTTPGSPLYASEETLRAYEQAEGYVLADHILLPTIDSATYQPLDEETVAANRALAEELLGQLLASDDPVALFGTLADEYSSDPGRASNPNGYLITPDSGFVEEFKDTAFALAENEISGVVESAYGYHILLRRGIDPQTLREGYFEVLLDDAIASAELVTSDAFDKLGVEALYGAFYGEAAG